MMVHKTKQVGFEPMFESLHSWSISYAGGISFQILWAQYLKARLPKSVVTELGTLSGC